MDSGGSLKTAVCSAAETVPMAVPVMMGFITAQRTMASAANAAEIPVASGAMVPLGDSVNGGSFGNSTSAEAAAAVAGKTGIICGGGVSSGMLDRDFLQKKRPPPPAHALSPFPRGLDMAKQGPGD